jgi:hypothetical protein
VFDVKPYLQDSVFQELRNEAYFRLVRPAHHGIAWPHEQDFSADTIICDIQQAQGRAGGMVEGAFEDNSGRGEPCVRPWLPDAMEQGDHKDRPYATMPSASILAPNATQPQQTPQVRRR